MLFKVHAILGIEQYAQENSLTQQRQSYIVNHALSL